jgi:phosphoribosylanthranilate isomerase
MLTQVYEISTPEEASAISAIGVDHVGVLVGDGRFPRELPISAASDIGAAIAPPSKFSALFLTCDTSLIASWARELNPSIVHLGASAELLSPKDVASLKRLLPGIVVMRSIPVFGEQSVAIACSLRWHCRLSASRQLSAHRRARRDARLEYQSPHRGPRPCSCCPCRRPRT